MCTGKVGRSFVGETDCNKLSAPGAFALCANGFGETDPLVACGNRIATTHQYKNGFVGFESNERSDLIAMTLHFVLSSAGARGPTGDDAEKITRTKNNDSALFSPLEGKACHRNHVLKA